MKVVEEVARFSAALESVRAEGQRVGLVPTMGALHAGHHELIRRAVVECDAVAVTIFVNPLQFGDAGDLTAYPEAPAEDLAACESFGASVVFTPPVEEMYPGWPAPPATTVTVSGLSTVLEGASRPGHFDGVATVVAKLFAMTGSCRAYFGEKDFQQLVLVRRMARDLSFPVTVVGCETVRDRDGLALSSRNVRLSPAERAAAPVLYRAMGTGATAMAAGETDPAAVEAAMAAEVATEPLAELDYAVVVRADDLTTPETLAPPVSGPTIGGAGPALRLVVAARIGPVRLIDNCDPRSAATLQTAILRAD